MSTPIPLPWGSHKMIAAICHRLSVKPERIVKIHRSPTSQSTIVMYFPNMSPLLEMEAIDELTLLRLEHELGDSPF